MPYPRVIAVVIVNRGVVVQSEQFRHTHPIHSDALHAIEAFDAAAADEIVLLDVSRKKDERFPEILDHVTSTCFIPVSAGGWITSMDYAHELTRNGADKLVINTILEDDPELVTELASVFGRQAVVASIDVKDGDVWVDRGRRRVASDALQWALRATQLGAGEILLNDIDHDGNRQGYNLPLLRKVAEGVTVPVVAFGGVSEWQHLLDGLEAGASAVAAANKWHYSEGAIRKAKKFLRENGIETRNEILL
jgi:cyclase